MSDPLVSFIIPVYNGEKYLGGAIRSALNQSYGDVEVVVIDDGSTDGTREIIRSFSGSVVARYLPHQGVAAARNQGASIASGDLLSFLDADDLIAPEKTSDQWAMFQEQPTVDFSSCLARNFWSPDAPYMERDLRHPLAGAIAQPADFLVGSWMVRRELFDRVGGFDESLNYAEDLDFVMRCKESGANFDTLRKIRLFRRVHADNAVNRNFVEQRRALTHVFEARVRRVGGRQRKAQGTARPLRAT